MSIIQKLKYLVITCMKQVWFRSNKIWYALWKQFVFVSTTGTLIKTFHPLVKLRLDPWNGKPAKYESKQTVSKFDSDRKRIRSLFDRVIYIIPSTIYTVIKNILKSGSKVTAKDHPNDFWLYITFVETPPMLKCVIQRGVESMPDVSMDICHHIHLPAAVTLCDKRNS
jgi:hypothetical protein